MLVLGCHSIPVCHDIDGFNMVYHGSQAISICADILIRKLYETCAFLNFKTSDIEYHSPLCHDILLYVVGMKKEAYCTKGDFFFAEGNIYVVVLTCCCGRTGFSMATNNLM